MMQLIDWYSESIKTIDPETWSGKQYRCAFTLDHGYDQREDWSTQLLNKISEEIISFEYLPEDAELVINSAKYTLQTVAQFEIPDGNILVDSTSLSFPELLCIFSYLKQKNREFDVVYIQPTDYKENDASTMDLGTSFDLSDDGLGIQQLPPYVGPCDNSQILFFLGWEGHRLGAFIHAEEFNLKNLTCLLGVPAFKAGWENKTISCNFRQLSEICNLTTPRIKYSGANDPIRTYDVIQEVYRSISFEKKKLLLAPFGTKPTAIAAAQFAVNNNSDLIVLYDFVKKKIGRSTGTDLLHIWSFSFDDS